MTVETTAALLALALIGTTIAAALAIGYLAGLPVWATMALAGASLKGLCQLPRLFPAPRSR